MKLVTAYKVVGGPGRQIAPFQLVIERLDNREHPLAAIALTLADLVQELYDAGLLSTTAIEQITACYSIFPPREQED